MIAFVQYFALNCHGSGGSSKILRSLLATDHPPVISINTKSPAMSPDARAGEIDLPLRPSFGRLERTRLHRSLGLFDRLYRPRFKAQLRRTLLAHGVKAIHTIAATYDFPSICGVASELNIPYFLSVHDDMEYVSRGHPFIREMRAGMEKAWRQARGVFVISEEIGQEYVRRYGLRDYVILTDGITSIAEAPLVRPDKSLRLYFMGLFHNTYAANLRAVMDGLKIVRSKHPDWDITITCRSGGISTPVYDNDVRVNVLPFAPESEVERDMLSADLLYQPLPFAAQARSFGRFSMSTKMITYLASGLPLFYHGPEDAAAFRLLKGYRAAITCTTLDAETVAQQLVEAVLGRRSIVENALALAQSNFMLADQQRRFWSAITAAL